MTDITGYLTHDQLADLWSRLPQDTQAIFRTDGNDRSTWRQLMAFNPSQTFILEKITQLPDFRSFLHEHRDKLCAGYLSYDLGLNLHQLPSRHSRQMPLAIFHVFENWLEIEPETVNIIGSNSIFKETLIQLLNKDPDPLSEYLPLHFESSVRQNEYAQNIGLIHNYIRAGDFYQINYTQRLHAETETASRALYSKMIRHHPAAHACYFQQDNLAIHSLSPELFLHYADGILTTEPIKGTRPRGKDETEDNILRLELLNSEKEQAELFMITDLLRNDLGKVCEINSIKLEAIKKLRKLPRVWHTYSRISGKLNAGLQPIEALLSMFPGGSITGCPKRRALEVIDELENSPREIYTGSMGYFHPDGDFSFNIAIRTLVQQGSRLSLGSGGGITIDSDWQGEWEELLVKASTFE
ncbi:MAG: anthranilate synthase component I family protein [Candidatus Marinimicrobia bacterium]|nr:anthranilate synthase component I family protein [Candidatus Neomarinimicrobiota bacterium]